MLATLFTRLSKVLGSSKLAALASFAYQSAASLAMFLVVGWLLPPGEYSAFSLAFATAQFCAIGLFEWIRLAASRCYPGLDADAEHKQGRLLQMEFLASAAVGSTIALVAWAGWVDGRTAFAVALVAVGQGATDLALTALRFRGAFRLFARLLSLRATLSAVLAVGAAALTGSAIAVLFAVAVSSAATIAVGCLVDPGLRLRTTGGPPFAGLREHAAYGGPAALASAMNLAATLALRYAIPWVAEPRIASGVLLALDLLQRPFNIVLTALHSVLYPPLVQSFDRGDGRAAYSKLISVEVSVTAAMFGGVVIALPFVVPFVVAPALRAGFESAAMVVLLLFGARSIFLNVAYLKYHLHRKTRSIMLFSLFDLVSYAAILGGALLLRVDDVTAVLGAGSFASALLMAAAFVVGRRHSLTHAVGVGDDDPKA